jgi:hypothetical protein
MISSIPVGHDEVAVIAPYWYRQFVYVPATSDVEGRDTAFGGSLDGR